MPRVALVFLKSISDDAAGDRAKDSGGGRNGARGRAKLARVYSTTR